jgi:hypothetical protein
VDIAKVAADGHAAAEVLSHMSGRSDDDNTDTAWWQQGAALQSKGGAQCPACSARFKEVRQLTGHMRVHGGWKGRRPKK